MRWIIPGQRRDRLPRLDAAAILEATHDAFIAMDRDGRVVEWSAHAESIFGWRRHETLGKQLAELIVPLRFREDHMRGIRHFLETGEGPILKRRIEMAALHRDGYELPVELTVSLLERRGQIIFGAFLHDISSRKRAEQLQILQVAVTRILYEAETIDEARIKVLEAMTRTLGWDLAMWWTPDAAGQRLSFQAAWHERSPALDELEAASRRLAYARGRGLAGRVLAQARPLWIDDLTAVTAVHPLPYMAHAELRGAFAFPILAGGEVAGVIELYSQRFRPQDDKLIALATDIGIRLGMFQQRKHAEDGLKQLSRRLEERVEARSRDLASKNDALRREAGERQRIQADLQTRETQLALITDSLPMSVLYLDSELRYLFVNETYAKWRGLAKSEIVGRYVREIVDDETFRRVLPALKGAMAGRSSTYEIEVAYPDSTRMLTVTLIPDFDGRGRVRGIVSVSTDTTEQKAGEAEMRRAKDAAESANRAKSAFLANMSHEIRTPLGAILGYSELILNTALPMSERSRYAEAVKRNGELLSKLISDTLDLSRVEAGKLETEAVDTSIAALFDDLTVALHLQAAEKGLKLAFLVDPDMPEAIRTDPLRLRQILLNVVGNALKFTERGCVTVTARRRPGLRGRPAVAFIVKDTGSGIRPEQVSELFEPFTQGDASMTRRFGGSGLGLPLARRLARLLGGDVELSEAIPGVGSTFTVYVDAGEPAIVQPRALATASVPKPALRIVSGGSPEEPPEPRLDGVKILLVEDAPDNQLIVSRLLSLAGAEVEVASDGDEGLRKAQGGAYDIVLMDLSMPVMDGYEATRRLRQGGYLKPVLALTAHALKEDRKRCVECGFEDHLTKPVDRLRLLHAVDRYRPELRSTYSPPTM